MHLIAGIFVAALSVFLVPWAKWFYDDGMYLMCGVAIVVFLLGLYGALTIIGS
jgi:hypothetical protein